MEKLMERGKNDQFQPNMKLITAQLLANHMHTKITNLMMGAHPLALTPQIQALLR